MVVRVTLPSFEEVTMYSPPAQTVAFFGVCLAWILILLEDTLGTLKFQYL